MTLDDIPSISAPVVKTDEILMTFARPLVGFFIIRTAGAAPKYLSTPHRIISPKTKPLWRIMAVNFESRAKLP
ncbi:hypothetical protein [Serratia ureilytica]|uniref:hypothetical protein n=1 Tax=Serratia ureilytica TaxID=300181 RepID=UPI0018D68FDE|nr:hypothetical protein [Serratia ureilytica]MBH2516435.1 hypothetical protein [Serratia ureilytica]MBH2532504.1 hypothetical protein [Serratia ureilytica]